LSEKDNCTSDKLSK